MLNELLNIRKLFALACVAILLPGSLLAKATITLDPNTTHQTIKGWELAVLERRDWPTLDNFIDQVYENAVEAGFNRVQIVVTAGVENDTDYYKLYRDGQISYNEWKANRYATVNDNNDPGVINSAGFHFSWLDESVDDLLLFKQKLEARGDVLYFNLQYNAYTTQNGSGKNYIHDDPDEYAEFILATFNHLKTKYGIIPDSLTPILEPDHSSTEFWDVNILANAILKVMPLLQANGYTPALNAPETMQMNNAITYIDTLANTTGVLQYLKEITYHRYGGVSDSNLQTLANRAQQYNLDLSMTEWWLDQNSYKILHKDLKMGRNSAWQQGGFVSSYSPGQTWGAMAASHVDNSDPDNPVVRLGDKTKFTRQYFKYVRPGAVRIDSSSSDADFDPLSFINANGTHITVVNTDGAGDIAIVGLPAGTYGVSYTTSTSSWGVEQAKTTITTGQTLNTNIPGAGVITVYNNTFLTDPGIEDTDGDGVNDPQDAFPLDATEWDDTDGDGIGNNADTDDDGDGVADSEDAFPLDATEWDDTDGDGIGNNADTDDDGDGVADSEDAYPLDPTRSQIPDDNSSTGGGGGGGTVHWITMLLLLPVFFRRRYC